MSKVNTNFNNVATFTGWWVAKRVIGLESYLVEGDTYNITSFIVIKNGEKLLYLVSVRLTSSSGWVLLP